jgi:hypothetical protein
MAGLRFRLPRRKITSTVIVVFVLNLVFNHWTWRRPQADDAIDEALRYAVSDGQQTG